jgi:hypothetical protein
MIKLTLGVGGLEGRFVGSGVGFEVGGGVAFVGCGVGEFVGGEVGATPQPAPPFH